MAERGVTLARIVAAELARPVPAPVRTLAAALAARAGGGAAAVLFYGSALREQDRDAALGGVLDFYVLVDDTRDWPGSRAAAWANRWLPPNVGYSGGPPRAKYAVMTLAQFGAAMRADSLHTTLWARFSQPAACVWARGDADRSAVVDAIAAAVATAARWAAALGPARAAPADYWRALYRATYAAELRIERGAARAADLVDADRGRYAALLAPAWDAAAIAFGRDADGTVAPVLTAAERGLAARRWRLRLRLGRLLNLLRLLKAATTFDNAIDYVAWKVERHSGHRIEPTAFQRRHPLLAAPALYLRLRARGVLR